MTNENETTRISAAQAQALVFVSSLRSNWWTYDMVGGQHLLVDSKIMKVLQKDTKAGQRQETARAARLRGPLCTS